MIKHPWVVLLGLMEPLLSGFKTNLLTKKLRSYTPAIQTPTTGLLIVALNSWAALMPLNLRNKPAA